MNLTSGHLLGMGLSQEFIDAAAGKGIPWQMLLQLILKYGLEVICLIAPMYGLPIPPGLCTGPIPPLPPPTP